ncbi:hypothetical protein SAMN04487904_114121 [Actinopolyspora lacussalsi subsp. righensis]|uniref:Uncharacterized protein n=1 Tax=Actinopolyspora righensis TaxID=995060 RepID=A0A1I7C575_9ACTN|nr:hypothetical protein SAMN04487904_114121 [Actinopolyspora righensis]
MLVFVLAGTLTPSLPRDYSISHSLPGMHRTPTYGGPRCSTRRSGRGRRRRRLFGRVCSSRRTDALGGRPRGRVVHREHPPSTAHGSRSEAGRDTSTTKRGQRISRSKYATARRSRACSPGRSSSEPVRRGAPPHSRRASAGRRPYGRAARHTPSRGNSRETVPLRTRRDHHLGTRQLLLGALGGMFGACGSATDPLRHHLDPASPRDAVVLLWCPVTRRRR